MLQNGGAGLPLIVGDPVAQRAWWLGALAGLLHGLFLLAAGLPLLPYIHPRMASEYDGATATRQLEPGLMGLNYGHRSL